MIFEGKSKYQPQTRRKNIYDYSLSTPLSPIWQNSKDKCCRVLFFFIPLEEKEICVFVSKT